MEENQSSSFKVALNFALITAAIIIVLDLILYVLDVPFDSEIKYISWLVFLGGIIWSQIVYRDNYSGGLISYGKSFSVGFTVGFFAALIVSIYTFVSLKYLDPSVIIQMREAAEQSMYDSGDYTEEQIEQAMGISAKFVSNEIMLPIWGILFSTLGVTVISLVTSIFIKKEQA